jgi:thiamine pyrophosphate-dependent acetolactate synthase large subunit-like protein
MAQGIRFVAMRNEQTAAYAANAYGKFIGCSAQRKFLFK